MRLSSNRSRFSTNEKLEWTLVIIYIAYYWSIYEEISKINVVCHGYSLCKKGLISYKVLIRVVKNDFLRIVN